MEKLLETIRGEKKVCSCDVVIRVHGSMLTGRTSDHIPNPNHISYYCLGCGKWYTKDTVPEKTKVIDLFGHKDALLIGYDTSSALVDYLRAYAEFSYDKMDVVDIKSFIDDIEIMKEKDELIVPEEFIRRK